MISKLCFFFIFVLFTREYIIGRWVPFYFCECRVCTYFNSCIFFKLKKVWVLISIYISKHVFFKITLSISWNDVKVILFFIFRFIHARLYYGAMSPILFLWMPRLCSINNSIIFKIKSMSSLKHQFRKSMTL